MEQMRDPDINPFNDMDSDDDYTNALIDGIINLKDRMMEQKNFDYLKESLLYTGFGTGLSRKLEAALRGGSPEFTLKTQNTIGKSQVDYSLNFKKGKKEGLYFFNSYDATLSNQEGKDVSMRIYNGKDKTITAKEAFNLLSGRAVYRPKVLNKEGKEYSAWVKLDTSVTDSSGRPHVDTFTEGYGFDLEKTLEKYPIVDMADPEKRKNVLDSLKRGNRQAVDYDLDGSIKKVYIEANPQFKAIDVYDRETGKKIFIPIKKNEKEVNLQGKARKAKKDVGLGQSSGGETAKKPAKQKARGIRM